MPRSLHSCMNFIHETLERLCDNNSRELERQAGELHARLHYGRTEDIMHAGLHEYLMDFLEQISRLGAEVNKAFLVPADVPVPQVPIGSPPRQVASTLHAVRSLL